MAIPLMNDDVEIIQKLNDLPNQEDGLSPQQMKERFDAASVLIKAYLNGTLVPAVQQLQKALNNGDIIGLDDTLSVAGQAADAAAVGTALAGVNTALAGKLPWGENIIVSKSDNTGSLWEQLEKFFTKEKDEIFPYGTVMYCRVSNADPYDNTLPSGGLVAEIAKTGKDESEKYYGYVRLVSYTNDSLGMPREFTRCYMGETGFQDLVERGPAIVSKIEELINAKITAATGVAE